jgi:hypothetical protein
MRPPRAVLLFAVVGATVLGAIHPAGAIIARHDVDEQRYLDLGQTEPMRPVGRVQFERSDGLSFAGSGTLIAPDLVLTAAHVVDFGSESNYRFQTEGGTLIPAVDVIINPAWTGDILGGGDVALVRLESPVTGVAPAYITSGVEPFGQEILAGGYGGTGDGLTGWDGLFDQQRRAATNILEPLGTHDTDEFYTFDFDLPGFPLPPTDITDLEGMAMFGDSGGPILSDASGRWEIIGTTSYIWDIDGDNPGGWRGLYYDVFGATRLLPYRDWINSHIPAPGAAAALGAGLALAGGRRRRAA